MLTAKHTMNSRGDCWTHRQKTWKCMEAIRNMEPAWEKVHGRKFSLMFSISELPNGGQRKDPYYELTQKLSVCTFATKFNDEARARLIIRWEELEKQHFMNPVTNPDTISNHSSELEKSRGWPSTFTGNHRDTAKGTFPRPPQGGVLQWGYAEREPYTHKHHCKEVRDECS